jgi:hypothetical protein
MNRASYRKRLGAPFVGFFGDFGGNLDIKAGHIYIQAAPRRVNRLSSVPGTWSLNQFWMVK